MRVVLLEDDHFQAAYIADEVRWNFSDSHVEQISAESEFRRRFDGFTKNPPDLFVLDVVVRWSDPGPLVVPVPAEVRQSGPSRAGIRCQQMLAQNETTKSVPVVIYSILERADYEAELGHPLPNVVTINKGDRGRLLAVIRSMSRAAMVPQQHKPAVFVVHGHDDEAKETVARFIERLGLNAVILHEQPSLGKTIIEKFETHSEVAYAVVLLTPDDLAKPRTGRAKLRGRARQNVIFELGYFAAKLGRQNLCALYKPDVEIPSDFQGVLYIGMDSAGAWRSRLRREMGAAGLLIDTDEGLW